MNNKIKIQFDSKKFGLEEYETDSIFKSTAWLIAVGNGFEGGLAQEVAELCFLIWLDIDTPDISEFMIIDYVAENYDDLPDDYKEIKDMVLDHYIWRI